MVVCGTVLSGKIDWQINKFCFETDVMFVLRIVFGLYPTNDSITKKINDELNRHSPAKPNFQISQKKIQTRLKSVLNSDVLLSITCNDQTQRQRVQKARWFTRRPVTQNRWYRSCCVGWFLFVSRQTIHTT